MFSIFNQQNQKHFFPIRNRGQKKGRIIRFLPLTDYFFFSYPIECGHNHLLSNIFIAISKYLVFNKDLFQRNVYAF